MLIPEVFAALRQGKELANAATWKNRAAAGSAVAALLTCAITVSNALGYVVVVEPEVVQAIADGIAAVGFIANSFLHIATSEKVGLPARPDDTGDVSVQRDGPTATSADVLHTGG